MGRRLKKPFRRLLKLIVFLAFVIGGKMLWVACATSGHGTLEGEKADILRRRNYLSNLLVTTPAGVLDAMPNSIGEQFQGEWAMYSCAMFSAALVNIAKLYPEERERSMEEVDRLIGIVMSATLRNYDAARWREDPLESLEGDKSHMSYLSILAWMVSGYREVSDSDKYDDLYGKLCATLVRRMKKSPTLNLQTYPGEAVYVPDMLVTLVALSNYTRQVDDRYAEIVRTWVDKAKTEWCDKETGLLKSFLNYDGSELSEPIKGSYSALNCYYLTFVDEGFAREQYEKMKMVFLQRSPMGIKEYYDRSCWLGMDVDAGPIIGNLSPSGTAFAIGSATYFQDEEVRNGLLKTAEIAGSTFRIGNYSHYLLANMALVGEAVTLAMRTSFP
ncbi:MAG: hypothetical protein IJ197_05845 [Bacteroidaceae bacterium]|nr:hypothetical protein [Bacteroidaceae bacterium]